MKVDDLRVPLFLETSISPLFNLTFAVFLLTGRQSAPQLIHVEALWYHTFLGETSPFAEKCAKLGIFVWLNQGSMAIDYG